MKRILGVIILISLASCSNMERLDTGAVKSAMDAYKIKKISEADVMSALNKRGMQIKEQISRVSCSERHLFADSLTRAAGVSIEGIDPEGYSSAIAKDQQMVEAFSFELQNGRSVDPTPQKLDDSLYAFYFDLICAEKDSTLELWKVVIDKASLIQGMD